MNFKILKSKGLWLDSLSITVALIALIPLIPLIDLNAVETPK